MTKKRKTTQQPAHSNQNHHDMFLQLQQKEPQTRAGCNPPLNHHKPSRTRGIQKVDSPTNEGEKLGIKYMKSYTVIHGYVHLRI